MSSRKRSRDYRDDSRERKRRKYKNESSDYYDDYDSYSSSSRSRRHEYDRERERDRGRESSSRHDRDRYYDDYESSKGRSSHRDRYREGEDEYRTSSSRRYRDSSKERDSEYKKDKKDEENSTEKKALNISSAAKLGINISDLSAKLAAAKAAVSQKKAALENKREPTSEKAEEISSSGTSEEAKHALRVAQAKINSKKLIPKMAPLGDNLSVQAVQIKESLINRRIEREKLDLETKPVESQKHFDPRLAQKKDNQREKRSFNFITPGTYIRQGQNMRAEIFTNQKSFNESDPLNKRLFKQLRRDPVPQVEWWDCFLLPSSEDYDLDSIKFDKLNIYIEHPVPEKLPEKDKSDSHSTFLTKKEKKRLRRIRREETQKEKQIKVMLGLEKPPEPRATLTNMTRVYGSKAYEDPTKIEQMVRQQMQERLDKHLTQNLERKLTPEQKKQKKLEKLRKNETGEIQVVVYKIKDISHPLHRKNIDHTTRDGALSGVLTICEQGDCNLLVAEGGPRAIKKLRRLMEKRLQWTENNSSNTCDLVWEGILKKRQFKKFRFHECPTVDAAREVLESRNVAHYWDNAVAFSADLVD